eukprot:1994357-Rhodomonas_salina.2
MHKNYAGTVSNQVPSKLLANPQTSNHSIRRPEVPQHSWEQQQEPVLFHRDRTIMSRHATHGVQFSQASTLGAILPQPLTCVLPI